LVELIEAVTFDVWNTLLEIRTFLNEVAKHLSKLINKPVYEVSELVFRAFLRTKKAHLHGVFDDERVVEQSLEFMSKQMKIDEIEVLHKAFKLATESVDPSEIVIKGVEKILSEIKALGLKRAIIGNVVIWPGDYTRFLLKRANLDRYFSVQLYADEVRCSKPNKEIFTRALSELGIENPEKAVHIGDSLYEDFVGAILSRMKAILIDYKQDRIIEIGNGLAFIVPNINTVIKVIRRVGFKTS